MSTPAPPARTDSPAHCSVPGAACRMLSLELPDARPAWALLDACGARAFTGELVLHLDAVVRVWFLGGAMYVAERDGGPPLADRLVASGVVTSAQMHAGCVHVGGTAGLGRLVERVPELDRDVVETWLEMETAALVGEVAHEDVPAFELAHHRYHPTGVHRWYQRTTFGATRAPVVAASTVWPDAAGAPVVLALAPELPSLPA